MRKNNLFLILSLLLTSGLMAQVETLPAPVWHSNSFELLSNSRYSVHRGFQGSLPRQVLANVLWASSRAPKLGAWFELYAATPENVYRYDPQNRTLVVQRAGDHRCIPGSAFEVGIAAESDIEMGYAVQAGLLAGTAFWDSSGGDVVSCPMAFPARVASDSWSPQHPIGMLSVYGRQTASGFQHSVQARSSDSSLPMPRVDGPDTFEALISRLHQDSVFKPSDLTLSAISQILWAGYGVTPHTVAHGKQGTTIPSAIARYFLTGRIYLVRETGVQRYVNRLPPDTDLTTSDHRLELVTHGDLRKNLRAASPELPQSAPLYIVICAADPKQGYAVQEAAYAGLQYLLQAEELGLGGSLYAPGSSAERAAINSSLGLPKADQPVLIFSAGVPR